MKISIIIPVYNVEEYVEKCIKSIINQINNNYELILVNDGSTDRSGEICDYYAKNFKNIISMHTKNLGVSAARNVGINLAQGNLLAFVDADDTISNKYVEEIIQYFYENKIKIAQIGYRKLTNEKELFSSVSKKSKIYKNLSLYISKEKYCHSVWAYIFEKDLIKNNHIYFTKGLHYSEDQEFILKALALVNEIGVINQIYYNYFNRETSAVNAIINEKRALSQLIVLENVLEFYFINNVKIGKFQINTSDQLIDDFYIYGLLTGNLSDKYIHSLYCNFYDKLNREKLNKQLYNVTCTPKLFGSSYVKIIKLKSFYKRIFNFLK